MLDVEGFLESSRSHQLLKPAACNSWSFFIKAMICEAKTCTMGDTTSTHNILQHPQAKFAPKRWHSWSLSGILGDHCFPVCHQESPMFRKPTGTFLQIWKNTNLDQRSLSRAHVRVHVPKHEILTLIIHVKMHKCCAWHAESHFLGYQLNWNIFVFQNSQHQFSKCHNFPHCAAICFARQKQNDPTKTEWTWKRSLSEVNFGTYLHPPTPFKYPDPERSMHQLVPAGTNVCSFRWESSTTNWWSWYFIFLLFSGGRGWMVVRCPTQ